MASTEGRAARFVWFGSDGEVLRYLTWTDFQVESGAFETSETLAFLISSLYMELTRVRVTHDNYRIIEDPAAYREEYARSNRQIRKLRYHVDQMQVTEFDVEDFDAIEAPVLQGTEVVVYFENGSGQPNRLAFGLHELGWNMELAMVPLYTERVTSDTGGLLDMPRAVESPVDMPRAVESPAEDDELS